MQRIGFEFSIRLPVQQAHVDVSTKTSLGLTGYRGQFVQTPGPGHHAMLQALRRHDGAGGKGIKTLDPIAASRYCSGCKSNEEVIGVHRTSPSWSGGGFGDTT